MKRRAVLLSGIFIIILVAGLLIFLIAKSFNDITPYLFTPSTNLSYQEIGGLKLHDNIESKTFKRFGSSVLINQSKNLYSERLWHKGLVTFSIKSGKSKGRIVAYMLVGIANIGEVKLPAFLNPQHTAKGIKLGDTKKQVIAKYGKRYYQYTDADADRVIGYIDRHIHIKLEFVLDKGDLVYSIRLADQNVN